MREWALIRIGDSWWTGHAESAGRAVEAWREFLRLHPSHEEAPRVLLQVADTWAVSGRPAEASTAYLEFVEKHPEHDEAARAQFGAASARLALDDFDGAVAQWRVLLERWPDHALWAEAQRKVAEASFLKGRRAFEHLALEVDEWRTDLRLYPWWARWVFERSLHFVARLTVH